jgi:hypothetical protein
MKYFLRILNIKPKDNYYLKHGLYVTMKSNNIEAPEKILITSQVRLWHRITGLCVFLPEEIYIKDKEYWSEIGYLKG